MSRSNQLAGLITATPTSTLDTINEINTSLNNDANLSTTLTNSIATKMPLAGGAFTGNITIPNGGTIGSASDADAITIASTGKINTTSANAGTAFEIENTNGSTNYGLFIKGGTSSSNAHYALGINNSADSAIFRVMGNGNVGINTTNPASVLTVKSDATNDLANGIRLEANGSTNTPVLMYENNTAQGCIELFDGSTKTVRLMADGTSFFGRTKVAIGSNQSNSAPITYSSALLNLHEPVSDPSIGTIAHSQIHLYNGTIIGDHSTLSFGYNVSGVTNTTAYISYVSTNQGAYGYGDLIFGTRSVNTDTAPSERMRIDASGNVHVARQQTGWAGGGGFRYDGSLESVISGGPAFRAGRGTSHGVIIDFKYNNVVVGHISTNSNSLPSDRNFKKDIADITLGLDFVDSLKPKSFRFNLCEETDPKMFGLIAQDLEESLNQCGIEKNSLTLLQHKPNDNENESDYDVDYLKLTPVLIKAIQELSAKVTALENAS